MLIFLYGEDDFSSREKLDEIKNKFLARDRSGSGLFVIEGCETNAASKFSEVAASEGLFSKKKLIVVKNLLTEGSADAQNEALEYLKSKKNIAESRDIVIVFWEESEPKKSAKLFSYLAKHAKKQKFSRLEGAKISSWAAGRFKKYDAKAKISKKALEKLMAYVGNDLFQLDNEIEKLLNFSAGKEIGEKDVEILVKSKISADIFETIEALSGGNKKEALRLLYNQIEAGGDPFYILTMYVYQIRNLLKIGDFYWKGVKNQYEIAKLARIHPYVVQKAMAQMRNFTKEKLLEIYQKLQKIDLGVKIGKVDINMALDKFVVEI
jgi:DNA polymerase-3 subunit delta